jgi:hypothetical protein
MTIHVVVSFDVTGWEPSPYEEEVPGPRLFRVKVRKAFRGELEAESSGELLMCVGDPANLAAGAGYVVSERVVGRLGHREGSFVLQHWGVSGGGRPQSTAGHVVPGSGTGQLVGLTGTITIDADATGAHALTLDYEI